MKGEGEGKISNDGCQTGSGEGGSRISEQARAAAAAAVAEGGVLATLSRSCRWVGCRACSVKSVADVRCMLKRGAMVGIKRTADAG